MVKLTCKTAAAVFLLLLFTVICAFGQATDGNIVGTVLDSSGAAVPNATIQVENLATGVKISSKTDPSGVYRVPNLLVGIYKVSASAAGFSTTAVDNVQVALNVVTTVNVKLEVGSVATTVEITGAAAQIDTTTAQVSTTYTTALAADLPVSTGNVLNLSLLGAGVSSSGGVGVGTGPSIGGQRPRNNSFNVEGVDNNRKDVTGPVVAVPNDTVAEFTLLQNQFSAEYGHSSGGQFNTVLKGGTNSLHGDIWEYMNNRNLNAVDQAYARQFVGQTLPPNPRLDQNRLGADIGGPIRKNKLFYFGSYQYNPVGQSSVPSAATYAPTAAGYATLATLPGINQTSLNILKTYLNPAPVQATGSKATTPVAGVNIPIGILPIVAPNYSNNYRWLITTDYNISDKDQLRGRLIDSKTSSQDTTANLPVFWVPLPITAYLAGISEFHNFSPGLINEFRLAFNRYNSNYVVPNFKWPGFDMFPNIAIQNDLNLQFGPDPNAPQGTIQNTYQLIENLSWTKGSHDLKFGVDARDLIAASTFIQRLRGDYDYSTLNLFLTDQFPDILAQRNVGGRPYSGNQTAYYAFVNDSWRANRHLTLNLGLRYEFNGVAQSMRLFDADAIANTPGVLTFRAPQSQKTNFAPRLGLAYSPGNNANTSIRAGFGIAYDQIFDNVGTNATPPQASATVNADPSLYPNGGFLAGGGITPNSVPSTLSPAQARAASSSYLPDQKLGYSINWNIGIQHVFHKDYTIETRYVGTKGVHLLFQTQINRNSLVSATRNLPMFTSAPSQATLDALPLGLCPAGAATAAPSCLTVGGNQNTLNNPLLGYGYSSTITGYEPLGNSHYHGLATELTRRFSSNLLFKGAYTWSHLIDDSTSEVNSTTLTPRRPQDFNNLGAEKATSALDHRNRFSFTVLYDVPWFKADHNWVKRNIVGNLRVSGVYIAETGELATPQSVSDANLNGDSAGDRTIVNPQGVAGTSSTVTALLNSNKATVGYLVANPNAQYIKALAGMYANGGRNTLLTPGINDFDLSLLKGFSFRERMKFELRADFFNTFNHPQYTAGTLDNVNLTQHIGQTNFLTPGNPVFGQFDQVFGSNPRNVQVGARLTF